MSSILITGATAGIGKSIAYSLAKRGYNLVLTGRRLVRLKEISEDISALHAVEVRVLANDLTKKEAPKQIKDFCTENNLDIEMLVLNAGYQHSKKLEDVSLEDEEDCLRVLAISVIMIFKVFLKDLLKRGGGKLMVVSSVAAFAPPSTAIAPLYGPIKTFMNRFVDTVNAGYNKNNIYATSLCPGFTVTEFHAVSGTQDRMNKVPSFFKMSSDFVAEEGVKGMLKNKELVIPGKHYWFLVNILKFFPLSIIKFIGNKISGDRFK